MLDMNSVVERSFRLFTPVHISEHRLSAMLPVIVVTLLMREHMIRGHWSLATFQFMMSFIVQGPLPSRLSLPFMGVQRPKRRFGGGLRLFQ